VPLTRLSFINGHERLPIAGGNGENAGGVEPRGVYEGAHYGYVSDVKPVVKLNTGHPDAKFSSLPLKFSHLGLRVYEEPRVLESFAHLDQLEMGDLNLVGVEEMVV
jgi:hypothetical protein